MNISEFQALEKSIRRGIKETKLEEGESPPDASTFLEEGELDQVLQLWGCFLGGATLEWKLAYLRAWHFGSFTTLFSAIFALALIVWACSHSESRWYR